MIVLMSATSIVAADNDLPVLSEMTESECIAFVKGCGVELPAWYENERYWGPFVKSVIVDVEANPNIEFGFGYSKLLDLAYEIKTVVIEYYGLSGIANNAKVSSTSNILEDNTVYGTWNNSYKNYNCYAYALGKTTTADPGDFSGHSYTTLPSLSVLANYVADDLEALGYTNVQVSTTRSMTSGYKKVICIRRGSWYDDSNLSMTTDYHVAKCNEAGGWLHKPGYTNPLKFKYAPASSTPWVYESYNGSKYVRDEDVTYSGTIYYISYILPHTCSYEYKYAGSNTHIRTCTLCGATTGAKLGCLYVDNNCSMCGHNKNQADSIPDIPELAMLHSIY